MTEFRYFQQDCRTLAREPACIRCHDIFLWENRQSITMDTTQQPPRVKHDRPICDQCQAASIKVRPDGSYSCNRCGYDSTKGKKKK
jgi:ribosomal protein S27AE